MNRIKIAGGLIFVLSVVLVILFGHITTKSRENRVMLTTISKQKSFTQEIAKSVLYIYKNRDSSSKELETNIEKFLDNMSRQSIESQKSDSILELWTEFYSLVKEFQKQHMVASTYSSLVTQKIVNEIYTKNLRLVVEFDQFIDTKQRVYRSSMESYKRIQYILFAMLLMLLIYLFTQVREVIAFIQKFSKTSKSIIQRSTIQGLEPIEVKSSDEELERAGQNYNQLLDRINSSIEYSHTSIEHATEALEGVEQNIEDFIQLLAQMQEDSSSDIFQKEDVVIDSQETLMNLTNRLKDLNGDLNELRASKATPRK